MSEVDPPTMTYEELEADVASRGLKAGDLLRSDGHYDRWRRRNLLTDADGTPQELFQRYQQDPDGDEACPPHANLWQFLLRAGESLGWLEKPGHRVKTVPICSAMFEPPEDLTDARVAEGRRLLEADAGKPLPDDVWTQFERQARKGPAAARRCLQEVNTLLERHGEEHPQFGRMLRVTLRVDC